MIEDNNTGGGIMAANTSPDTINNRQQDKIKIMLVDTEGAISTMANTIRLLTNMNQNIDVAIISRMNKDLQHVTCSMQAKWRYYLGKIEGKEIQITIIVINDHLNITSYKGNNNENEPVIVINEQVTIKGIFLPQIKYKKQTEPTLRIQIQNILDRTETEPNQSIIIAGQFNTRDPRWSETVRPEDNQRTILISKWSEENELSLVNENTTPTRIRGNMDKATQKVAWSKRCITSNWQVIDIPNVGHLKAITFNAEPIILGNQQTEVINNEIIDNERIREITEEIENIDLRDETRDQEYDTINNVETVDSDNENQMDAKIIQANTKNTETGMSRLKEYINNNISNIDVVIVIQPKLDTLRTWEEDWEVIYGYDNETAIIIINNQIIYDTIEGENQPGSIGAGIDIGNNNRTRLRALYLPAKSAPIIMYNQTISNKIKATLKADENIQSTKIITGDINMRHTKWSREITPHENGKTERLIEEIMDEKIGNMKIGNVYEGKNLHEVTFTNDLNKIIHWQTTDICITRSQYVIKFKIKGCKQIDEQYVRRNITRNNIDNDAIERLQESWEENRQQRTNNTDNINVLQINLQKSQNSMNLLLQKIIDESIDIVIMSEPYLYIGNKINMPGRLVKSTIENGKLNAAILVINKQINVIERQDLRHKNYSVITIGNETGQDKLSIISVYNRPIRSNRITNRQLDQRIKETNELLTDIIDTKNKLGGRVIIAGDFNIKDPNYNSGNTHSPEEIIELFREFVTANNLVIMNQAHIPTCINCNALGGTSTIDYTLAPETDNNYSEAVINWRVEPEATGSDHRYIRWEIDNRSSYKSTNRQPRYNIENDEHNLILKRILETKFSSQYNDMEQDNINTMDKIDKWVQKLTKNIQESMIESKIEFKRMREQKRQEEILARQATRQQRIQHRPEQNRTTEQSTPITNRTSNRDDNMQDCIRELQGLSINIEPEVVMQDCIRGPQGLQINTSPETVNNRQQISGGIMNEKRRRSARFWGPEIREARKRYKSHYFRWRRIVRKFKRGNQAYKQRTIFSFEEMRQEWLQHERDFKKLVIEARTEDFRKKCEINENKDAFQQVYKIAFNKYKPETALTNIKGQNNENLTEIKDILEHMLNINFPKDNKGEDDRRQRKLRQKILEADHRDYKNWKGVNISVNTCTNELEESEYDNINEINNDIRQLDTEKEAPPIIDFINAISRTANHKAPGDDGITAEVVKTAKEQLAMVLQLIVKACLQIGYFPREWKKANVIMIPKPGKDQQTAKGWRPICLLSTLAKIMDRIMIENIMNDMIQKGKFNQNQYGFMQRKSTTLAIKDADRIIRIKREKHGYVAGLFLDIGGAFDTAWHITLKKKLRESNCPINWYYLITNYLKDREIKYERNGIVIKRDTNRGCPQGSSSGPGIWNIVYDEMLNLNKKFDWARFQAYADDGLIIVWANNMEQLIKRCNEALNKVINWGKKNKLTFNAEKTEIITFLKKDPIRRGVGRGNKAPTHGAHNSISLTAEGKQIDSKEYVRYLGVYMDNKLKYRQHVDIAINKANIAIKKLCALAQKGWGLSPGVMRVIYKVAVETVFTYGCPVWLNEVIKNKRIKEKIEKWHRKVTQKVARTMATTSSSDPSFIADILPIELRMKELATNWRLKNESDSYINKSSQGNKQINRQSLHKAHPVNKINMNTTNVINYKRQITKNDILKAKNWLLEATENENTIEQTTKYFKNRQCKITWRRKYKKHKGDNAKVDLKETIANAIHEIIDKVREKRTRATSRIIANIITNIDLLENNTTENRTMRVLSKAYEKAKDWNIQLNITITNRISGYQRLPKNCIMNNKKITTYKDIAQETEPIFRKLWHKRWIKDDTGAHSRFLIGTVYDRKQMPYIEPTYELSQVYTGHSKLESFKHKLKMTDTPICKGCNENKEETLAHYILECNRWQENRTAINEWLATNRELWLINSELENRIDSQSTQIYNYATTRTNDETNQLDDNNNEETDIETIEQYRERTKTPTRAAKIYDKETGITAEIKKRQYEKDEKMRKIRALIQKEEGHRLLKQFVKQTGRLHISTLGIDEVTKNLIKRDRGNNRIQNINLSTRRLERPPNRNRTENDQESNREQRCNFRRNRTIREIERNMDERMHRHLEGLDNSVEYEPINDHG